MLTVMLCLVIAAFVCTVVVAWGKCPAWVPLVFICVIELLHTLPVGK